MALSAFVGTYTSSASTGNQAVTGVGFQPVAVIFWCGSVSADGFANDSVSSIGFGVSSTSRAAAGRIFRNGFAAIGSRIDATKCILQSGDAGTSVGMAADLVSLDSDGFTVNNTTAAARKVMFLALGGADITNAAVVNFVLNNTTGAQAVSGVGFKPDCVIFAHIRHADAGLPTVSGDAHLGIGCATAATQRWATFHNERNVATTDVSSGQRSDACLVSGTAAGYDMVADFTSFDTDGFTINQSTATTGWRVIALCLKGGKYFAGVETQQTSATTKATTGVGFTPKGLLLTSWNLAASSSVSNSRAAASIGASDGTHYQAHFAEGKDAVGTPVEVQDPNSANAIQMCTQPSTVDAAATVSSFDSDGFTLNWGTADATARQFSYLAFGSTPVASSPSMLLLGVG